MDHFIGIDPYTIGEHNRRLRAEIDALRLQSRLRENRTTAKALRTASGGAGARAGNREPSWSRSTKHLERDEKHRSYHSHDCPARA
jgi:hypothetical protein